MHFDLTDLRLLVAIDDAGSLSRAAAAFPIALSAASNRLRLLEQRIGLALFRRHTDGMHATPAGRIALDHARRVLEEAYRMRAALDNFSGRRRATVRIAANTAAASTYLPPALAPFLNDYPEVDIEVVEQASSEILRQVSTGAADIGVVDGNLPQGELVSIPFRHDHLVLFVPRDHPLAQRERCGIREALDYPFVAMPADRAMQRLVEKNILALGKPLVVRVRAPSFTAIAQLVVENVGVAVLPHAAALRHALSLPATIVLLEDAWANRELRLCVRSLDGLSGQTRQLVRYLTESPRQA